MENFRSPYLSTSVREFWSRWHISLSTWFRDYLYIPLGGNRKGKFRKNLNMLITFTISGLWHGANVTFVLWGLVHGVAQVIENLFGKTKEQGGKWKPLKTVCVFIFCSIAWIFFRANTYADVKYIFSMMFCGVSNPIQYINHAITSIGLPVGTIFFLIICVALLFLCDFMDLGHKNFELLDRFPKAIRIALYYILITTCLFSLYTNVESTQFVYFQF